MGGELEGSSEGEEVCVLTAHSHCPMAEATHYCKAVILQLKTKERVVPGGPVLKPHFSTAGSTGLIPDRGTKDATNHKAQPKKKVNKVG